MYRRITSYNVCYTKLLRVQCEARIELQARAEIIGDVHYGTIAIAHGAAITGMLVHQSQETVKKGVVTQFKPATSPPGVI